MNRNVRSYRVRPITQSKTVVRRYDEDDYFEVVGGDKAKAVNRAR